MFDCCRELLLEKLKLDVASTEGPYEAWMVRPALLLALSLMTVCDSDLRSNRSVAARSCSFSWVTSVSTVLVCSVVLLLRNVRDRVSLRRTFSMWAISPSSYRSRLCSTRFRSAMPRIFASPCPVGTVTPSPGIATTARSEEHTSELQSH